MSSIVNHMGNKFIFAFFIKTLKIQKEVCNGKWKSKAEACKQGSTLSLFPHRIIGANKDLNTIWFLS